MWSSLFFYCDGPHRHLHSFPTRRSSDLCMPLVRGPQNWLTGTRYDSGDPMSGNVANCSPPSSGNFDSPELAVIRSEEHTSELQSLRHLVCRLLLEKKKT